MRSAFENWAQRDGHIVRRREDKPDEYLVFETQRRWVIWQAALTHGKTAEAKAKAGAQKAAAKVAVTAVTPDEAAVRNRVLNEVLDAFGNLDGKAGIDSVLKVVEGLKAKQKALAENATA